MSLTLRERLHHLRPHATVESYGVEIRITAATEGRQDLCIVIVAEGRWSIFDPNTPEMEWLGDIVAEDGRFVTAHGDGSSTYRFDEFRLALSYFMEYGFALGLGLASGSTP